MSARLVVRKDSSPPKDAEGPRGERHPAVASDARPARRGHIAARRNPVVLAGAILRGVVATLAASDGAAADVARRPGVGATIARLLKDVVVGVAMGAVLILVAAALADHRAIADVRSVADDARGLRGAGAVARLLRDPETVATVEGSSGLRLMTQSEYETQRRKIDKFAERKARHEETLKQHRALLEEKRDELEAIRIEHDGLMNHPLIELNEFCGGCAWVGKTTCDGRVQFLQVTYNMRPIEAKMSAMEVPTCKKK